MQLAERCRTEVRDLHAFFEAWFNGAIEDSDVAFARFADVLHEDFRMIVPSGETLDRATVLSRVRGARGTADPAAPFRIEIRRHAEPVVRPDAALVTYEEWQWTGSDAPRGRASTAYFQIADATPNGIVWRHVHETWKSEGLEA